MKLWETLPSAVRWLLVTLLILVMTAGSVYAYIALTAEGEVTIEEALSFVGPSTFEVALYPGENDIAQLTVANASSVDIDVDLTSTVVPDPGPKGLTVAIPGKITAPAEGQVTIDITILVSQSAEPGTYMVFIEFER